MNPAKLNHRIRFTQLTNSVQNEYGGYTEVPVELITTWGSLVPVRQNNQYDVEAGASVLNGDKILIIRKRNSFAPAKDMIFEDLNNPYGKYKIHSILPYVESQTKTTPFNDDWYVYILGIKQQ